MAWPNGAPLRCGPEVESPIPLQYNSNPLQSNPSHTEIQFQQFHVLGQFRSLSAETYLRHCSLIPKRCNAIQTLLQLNSNNYSGGVIFFYIAVATRRNLSRLFATSGRI